MEQSPESSGSSTREWKSAREENFGERITAMHREREKKPVIIPLNMCELIHPFSIGVLCELIDLLLVLVYCAIRLCAICSYHYQTK